MRKLFFPLLVLALLLIVSVVPAFAGGITLHSEDWLNLAPLVIGGASIIANKTKTESDNKAISWFAKIIDFLALNWSGRFK